MRLSRFSVTLLTILILCFTANTNASDVNKNLEITKNSLQPHMTLESCFQCHVDARHVAVNPSGDIAVHYGATNLPTGTPGGHLLCVDCHSTLINLDVFNEHSRNNNATNLPQIQCHDCHGTLTKAPLEFTDINSKVLILRSDGTPFGNVVKQNAQIILKSVTGQKHEVTILKNQLLNNTWKTDLARQVKSLPKHNSQLECSDCHSDWAPVCYGCHE